MITGYSRRYPQFYKMRMGLSHEKQPVKKQRGLSQKDKVPKQRKCLSLRTSPQTGVAIPPIFEQLRPKIEGIYFYPGDCHASDVGHWLAMTASFRLF